jgi:threonine synthase
MKYLSTRGDRTPRGFSDILLEGLAPDGGLYLPTHYPKVDDATLARWRVLSYAELAFEILSLYIDDIPAADLQRLCHATYSKATYGTDAIVPLKPTAPRWPSRTWPCSCWAICSSTSWRDGAPS